MNLMEFSAADFFDQRSLLVAYPQYSAGLSAEQVQWTQAVGPVWSMPVGREFACAGFQADTRRGWKFVAVCRSCNSERCAHVATLALMIEREKAPDLNRWQKHFTNFVSTHGYYSGRPLPDLPNPVQIFDSWLATQSRSAALESARSSSYASGVDEDKHIFVLAADERASATARIRVGLSRPLKGKNKDQMTKMAWTSGRIDTRFRDAIRRDPPLQRFIKWSALNRINCGGREDSDTDDLVLDESGVDLLQDLACEGRLYWLDEESQRPVGPISWSDGTRPVDWTWQDEGQHFWMVRPKVQASGYFLTGSALYVDAESKLFGRLDLGGMAPNRVFAMLSAPAIPKEWLKENAHTSEAIRCLPRPPDEVLQRSTRVISGVKPTPVLTVAVAGKQDVFSISLAFRYGELLDFFAAGSDRIQLIKKGKETIELVREPSEEAISLRALEAEGLEFSNRIGDLRFSGDKAAQVDGFRRLLASNFANLRTAGFEIETVKGWSSKVFDKVSIDGGFEDAGADFSSPTAFLHFSLGFYIDGQRFNMLPLIPQLLTVVGGAEGIRAMTAAMKDDPELKAFDSTLWVVDEDGRWIGLPRARMAPWLGTLAELVADRKPRDLAGPTLLVSRIEALRLEVSSPDVDLGGNAAAVVQELLAAKSATDPLFISGFHGELEPFQRAGVRWMGVLGKYKLGGILGDDRGLGKTWQCIGHLADMKNRGELHSPALIVVPPTQIHHWRHHVHELAPDIKLLSLYGTERSTLIDSVPEYDAVLTSWDSVTRFVEQLRAHRFQIGILDETEKIHNASAMVSKGLRLLNIDYEIALNGSPVENHYGDLWSVVDAVLPGYLGTENSFKRSFRIPIELHNNEDRLRTLLLRISPFMLRRLKGESGVDLPPVVHQDVPLKIGGPQANLYELIRLTTEETVREALASSGLRGEPTSILPILTKLRQVCCDPSLTEAGREQGVVGSAKLDWLESKLDEMLQEGRRVLLVGFFVEFFHLIEEMLSRNGVAYSKIVGTMLPAKRELQKQAFKRGETQVFLLGLKSGGRGTDLPEADTVIHLDPWYNPKAHDQATDRAHRIGQTKTVTNLRLFVEGSIEERVIGIQDRKRMFADSLDSRTIFDEHKVTRQDILEMLRPLRPLDVDEACS